MSTTRARLLADGGGSGGGGGGEYAGTFDDAFHAFTVDADGMLVYTKVELREDASIQIASDPSDTTWNGITDSFDNYEPATGSAKTNTNFDQYKFAGRELFYFINDDGNLIARYNNDYTYTEPK